MKNKGIFVANLTAFRQGQLDLDAMQAHGDFLVRAGVKGLCPAGTTGEFLYLRTEEKKELFSTLIDAFRGRAEIWCCPWDADPDAMASLCRLVSHKGATGVFLPPPIYYEFSEAEIIGFYEFVRRNCSLPVYCYNIPKYTNNEITLATLQTLMEKKVIAGIKDSSADEARIKEIIARFGDAMDILAGGDHFALKAKMLGAHGFISALGNVYPELFVQIWDSASAEAQEKLPPIRAAIKNYGGIPALKYLLSKRGHFFGCRFPFHELEKAQKKELDRLSEEF